MSKQVAFGTKLTWDPTNITPVDIGQIRSFGGPSRTRASQDVTEFASPSQAREFIAGYLDEGELVCEIEWDAHQSQADAEHALGKLESRLASGVVEEWQVEFPDDGGTNSYRRFDAFVQAFNADSPVDGSTRANVTLKLTGPITSGTV